MTKKANGCGGYTPANHWSNDHERYAVWHGASIVGWYVSPFTAIAVARVAAKRATRTVTVSRVDRSTPATPTTVCERDILTVGGGAA